MQTVHIDKMTQNRFPVQSEKVRKLKLVLMNHL